MKIVSDPSQVCLEHAVEFWTGLLAFARDGSGSSVKQDLMHALSPEELSGSELRAFAIAAAGPSPRDHQPFPFRLAS